MKSGTKRTFLIALIATTLSAAFALAVWFNPAAPEHAAEANHTISLGVDTNTSGNSALALGAVQETCRVINLGQTIDVDIYVKGLNDLASWEAYIVYDQTKIQINKPGDSSQGQNARFLLQQAQPSPPGNNLINTSESLPDTVQPGIYRVGAADLVVIPGVEDPDPIGHTHKDGVLVRLEVSGIGGGYSPLNITPYDVGGGNYIGPFLRASTGALVNEGAIPGFFDATDTINGQLLVGSGACTDSDGDGIPDSSDNCPATPNPTQANFDGDSAGDACDIDDDNDGLVDTSEPAGCQFDPDCDNDLISDGPNNPDGGGPIVAGPDNCVTVANASQTNTDGDSMGDACDPDDDNDTILDGADNCPTVSNSSQTNTDGDGQGNACDPEDDGDGFDDSVELHVQTNPLDPCGNPTGSPSYSTAWPGDMWMDGTLSPNKADIFDLNSFLAPVRRMNTSEGQPGYNLRWDIYPGAGTLGDTINIQDLGRLITFTALMFNNQRAFDYPTPCTP